MSIFALGNPPDWFLVWGSNVLLQATSVTLLSLVVAGLFGRRAAIRHGIHCGSLFLLLFVPLIALVIQSSGWTWLVWPLPDALSDSWVEVTRTENRLPRSLPAASEVSGETSPDPIEPRDAQPASAPTATEAAAQSSMSDRSDDAQHLSATTWPPTVASRTHVASEASPTGSSAGMWHHFAIPLFFVWLVGSLALLCGTLVRWIRLTSLLRQGRAVTCETIRGTFAEVCRSMGVRTPPQLLVSSVIHTPFAAGLRRPSVVLPEAIVSSIDSEQLRQILAHELAHVARRDPLIAFIQNIVGGMFWLHPLVWVMSCRLAQAREEVCDNHVLAIADAPAYGRTLLFLAERMRIEKPLAGAVGLLTSRWRLETRIAGILDEERDLGIRMSTRGRLLVGTSLLAALAVAAGGTISWISPRSDDVARTTPNDDAASAANDRDEQIALLADKDARPVPDDLPPEAGRIDDLDEKIALLDRIALATRASWEAVKTFEGSGTYSASCDWEGGPASGTPRIERRANIRLAFDRPAKLLSVDWEEREPARLIGDDPAGTRLISRETNRFRSVMTADEWFDLRTAERFATDEVPLFGFDGSSLPRTLVIHSPGEARRLKREPEGMIDPLQWISITGRYFSAPHEFVWEEHEWLKTFREQSRRDGREDTILRNCDVIREVQDDGEVISVRQYWGSKGNPRRDDPETLRRLLVFDGRFGYALTRCEMRHGGNVSELAEIGYERQGDVAVPVHFRRKVIGLGPRSGQIPESLEVWLNRVEANQPIDPATFSADRLELRNGDRVANLRRDEFHSIENGERVAIDKKDLPYAREWQHKTQGVTSLYYPALVGREWNEMVRQQSELFNASQRINELPESERRAAYEKNRVATEKLARRHLALEPLQGRARNRLNGFENLGQVVCLEYAGEIADQAAEMLVRKGDLRTADQNNAMMLAYSLPVSLAADIVLRGMIAQSEPRGTQAQARMSLARLLTEQAQRKRMIDALPGRAARVEEEYGAWYVQRLGRLDPDAAEREAEALCHEVIEKFADVDAIGSLKEKLSVQAQRDLRRLQHAIGRQAPEIVGSDYDDKPLRLSDTNGKVRVLMFWGNWCGPCRRHYGHLRELMAKHAGDPFEMLGICSDGVKDKIRPSVENGTISWRFWWDGNDTPWRIHNDWGLAGAPWYFVLDRRGIIRFADVRGPELDLAVETLLQSGD